MEFSAALLMIWHGLGDQVPKAARMIHLSQVAQFVHDDVFAELRRQVNQLVVEVQIAFGTAAAPTAVQVFDGDAIKGQAVMPVVLCDSCFDERPAAFLVAQVIASAGRQKDAVATGFGLGQLLAHPGRVLADETRHRPVRCPRRHGH